MKTFLKMLLAVIVGSLLLGFIGFMILVSLVSLSDTKPPMQPNSVLRIDLNSVIRDRADNNPLAGFDPLAMETEYVLGLDQILSGLEAAAEDENIVGVYLEGGIPLTGHATIREIQVALNKFRDSGKWIYGYAEILSQKGLYLSSAADSFYVNPEGVVEWNGLSASVAYYKDALDKLGVQPEVLRATNNRYKSAVEPYMRSDMSPENRDQLSTLLNSVWTTYSRDIAEAQGANAEELRALADSFLIGEVAQAQAAKLIEVADYKDVVLKLLAKKTGNSSSDDISYVDIATYAEGKKLGGTKSIDENRVAVIIAQGEIVDGDGDEYTLGSIRISEAIRQARLDDKVKAVVLRVNSPGGSALASEVIWREVELTKREKPVIASMGDLAASGGYYISCYADTILAQPNTITGSIGAFGLFFTAQELMNDKLGINIETVTTNKFSDLGTIDRPLSDAEHRMLVKQVDKIYNTFKQRVATGRNLTVEYVDSIGQGRVWTGEDAMRLGLVDMMGGLEDAIALAAEKAGISEEYSTRVYPEQKDPLQQLIEQFGGNYQARVMERELGVFAPYLKTIQSLGQRRGMQMRMEYDLIID